MRVSRLLAASVCLATLSGGAGLLRAQEPPAQLVITSVVFPVGAVGQPFSFQLTAIGGTGTYTWTSESLPPGLVLSPSGLITGAPSAVGVFFVPLTVTSGPQSVSTSIVFGAFEITAPSELPEAEVALPYEIRFFTTQLLLNTWSVSAGTLPPGLTLSTAGVLSGTPTASGDYSFTLQVTHSNAGGPTTFQKAFSLRVNTTSPVQVTSSLLPYAGIGQSYAAQLEATGGNEEYSWSLIAPLPAGLLISPSGLIAGTPATGGVYPVSVRAESLGLEGTAQLALIVVEVETPSPIVVPSVAPFALRLRTNTGFPEWTATGALPPGLTLSSDGLISGSTVAEGNYSIRVKAKVANLGSAPAVTAEKTIVIRVTKPPLTLSTSSLGVGQFGGFYQQTLEASGGAPPYQFSVSTLPFGLTLQDGVLSGTPTVFGRYTITVGVTDTEEIHAERSYVLEIKPLGPNLQVRPGILRFTVPEGGEQSAPQTVTAIAGNGEPIAFTVDGRNASWLEIGPAEARTPRDFRVRARGAGLRAGTYSGSVRFHAEGQEVIEVPALLTVTAAAPELRVAPKVLRFTARDTVQDPVEGLLVVDRIGGGAPVNFETTVLNASPWIQAAAPAPAVVGNGNPAYVRVRVSARGLRSGSYRDVVRITSSAGDRDIPVALFVGAGGAQLELSTRGVRLTARQGQGSQPKQTVKIRNDGEAGSVAAWRARVIRGADVFTLSPASGEAMPGAPSTLQIGLKQGVANEAQSRSAVVEVYDPAGEGSPRYIVAVAEIASAFTLPAPELSPAGLLFTASQNGAAPPAQSVALSVSSAEPLRFAASAGDASEWLSVSPERGTISSAAGVRLSVSVKPGRLSPGPHTAVVHVAVGTEIRGVNITFAVSLAAGRAAATDDTRPYIAVGASTACTPSRLALAQTALAHNFAVPAGWPASLSVNLVDDCGSPIANGSVVARFSNGDAPLVLEGDGEPGEYTATWQPGAAHSQTAITLEAVAGTLTPATLEMIGGVLPAAIRPPALTSAGVVNNLSGMVAAALAPGTVAQVYGDNFSTFTSRPGSTPLPKQMLGVETIIGGMSAPIYYLSRSQINVQVPYELAPNRQHWALVASRDGYTLPEPVDVVPVQPAAYTAAGGMLIAMHANGTAVTAANPARPGEELSAYLVGMGATAPAVASGAASPAAPPATVATPAQVTIAGEAAAITFQGLAPGQVGLYQVNFRVPGKARTGNLDVVISQDGIVANSCKLAVAEQ